LVAAVMVAAETALVDLGAVVVVAVVTLMAMDAARCRREAAPMSGHLPAAAAATGRCRHHMLP
jgi:hypothetical protein